jgi:hypothetical protein
MYVYGDGTKERLAMPGLTMASSMTLLSWCVDRVTITAVHDNGAALEVVGQPGLKYAR